MRNSIVVVDGVAFAVYLLYEQHFVFSLFFSLPKGLCGKCDWRMDGGGGGWITLGWDGWVMLHGVQHSGGNKFCGLHGWVDGARSVVNNVQIDYILVCVVFLFLRSFPPLPNVKSPRECVSGGRQA